jgi:hypothetical protein
MVISIANSDFAYLSSLTLTYLNFRLLKDLLLSPRIYTYLSSFTLAYLHLRLPHGTKGGEIETNEETNR